MPDDTVFTTGGSTDYRGRGASDIRTAQFYLPAADIFVPAAEPTVGRNHHSEALLLPDGRVAVFGSDPLFSDKANSRPGHFEQRIEVYSPPYLFHGRRPHLKLKGSSDINRGDEIAFGLPDAAGIGRVRLMRPGSVTQGTDFDQRSVALDITRRTSGSLTVHVPDDPALVPHGWYMAFATNVDGTPRRRSGFMCAPRPEPTRAHGVLDSGRVSRRSSLGGVHRSPSARPPFDGRPRPGRPPTL